VGWPRDFVLLQVNIHLGGLMLITQWPSLFYWPCWCLEKVAYGIAFLFGGLVVLGIFLKAVELAVTAVRPYFLRPCISTQ
jgi:hypothetical protein